MYTVEKIEENIIVLENRNNKKLFEVDKKILPNNIKEGDVVEYINNNYIINEKNTKKIKTNIRNKFNSLIN